MKTEATRNIIAVVIVVAFAVPCLILMIVPILSDYEADRAGVYFGAVKDFIGIFVGVIGVVLGYYFGRKT